MRRLENRAFRVIIPLHVARMLAEVERTTAAVLKEELEGIAQRMGQVPPPFNEPHLREFTYKGTTVHYECDPENGALIVMDLTGNL